MSLAPKPNAASEKPRRIWERIVALTPVVMTVVATLLAGLSSSEMNQAQYHRAVASQNQSKAGDQWAFFQAKRIRGTQLELEVDRLPVAARPGILEFALLQTSAGRLTRALEEAQKQAQALQHAADESEVAPGRRGVQQFLQQVQRPGNTPTECQKRLEEALRNESLSAYLGTRALPEAKSAAEYDPKAKEAGHDPQLHAAVQAITNREPANKIADLVRPIKEPTILAAIDAAEARSQAVEAASAPIEEPLKKLTAAVNDLLGLAALCHHAALDREATSPAGGESSRAVQAFLQSEGRVRSAAEELNNLVLGLRHDYTSRRYRREADGNQQLAVLYEVQVHKTSLQSEGHRRRSQFFFLGMLGAQAGVTIASLALAAQQKSLLWSLAALAGLAAIAFSGWVFFSM
jgi:hypothetical protein